MLTGAWALDNNRGFGEPRGGLSAETRGICSSSLRAVCKGERQLGMSLAIELPGAPEVDSRLSSVFGR